MPGPPAGLATSAASGDAGLYLHVPFCSAVCPYCDFAVQVGKPALRAAFVDGLVSEIASWRDWCVPIDTVYFGGGTPSLLSEAQLARVLESVHEVLPLRGQVRVFLEANPEDVNADSVRAWRRLGVETLSLGVQSFDDSELRQLGRRHSRDDAIRAVSQCLDADFSTVSVDLMFGVPGQSVQQWRTSLEMVAELGPPHVSCYQLTIHEGTTFGRWQERGKLREMPEGDQAELFDLTHRRLADAGLHAYEVSNFARGPEHRSAHNQKYWRHQAYLGVGPSAHSFDGSKRWWNLRATGDYLGALAKGRRPVDAEETLGLEDLALEALMLGLRTTDGIELDDYERRFGVNLMERNRALLDDLMANGLLTVESARLRPTVPGLAVVDGISARLDCAPP